MKALRFNLVLCAAMAGPLLCSVQLHADTVYTTTNVVNTAQVSFTFVPNANGILATTTFTANNAGTSSLSNIYYVIDTERVSGQATTLVGQGDYSTSNGVFTANQVNAAAFLTQSQIDATITTAGSATIAQIPAFLIASSLAPNQTVTFTKQFELSSNATALNTTAYIATASTSVTPEPSTLLLLGTGLASVVGLVRRKASKLQG